jgi:hypothetical protein
MCMATNVNDLSLQGYSNVGAPWTYGYHSTTSYWHSAPQLPLLHVSPVADLDDRQQPAPRRRECHPG